MKCDDDCLTCTQEGACETCPVGFEKGKERCLACESNQYIEGN